MYYPDFKMRYAVLGQVSSHVFVTFNQDISNLSRDSFQSFFFQEEVESSSDNKVAAYALMDKIGFERSRYRLGHTLVFFRAGALAFLEECRDDIVLNLLRKFQGEVRKRIRGFTFAKKRDQRDLIKVTQRQFRKYMAMRTWGWFVIIQKTRPLIGKYVKVADG